MNLQLIPFLQSQQQITNVAQAVELTSGCPILEVGGFVEVRPVMKLS